MCKLLIMKPCNLCIKASVIKTCCKFRKRKLHNRNIVFTAFILLGVWIWKTLCGTRIFVLHDSIPQVVQRRLNVLDRNEKIISVAIGMAITSQNVEHINKETIKEKLPFFREFLPSVCTTASKEYIYRLYLAHDKNDPFFSNATSYQLMQNTFSSIASGTDLQMTLTMVQCTHDHSPAWAQNDAMMEAYMDNCDFYYRVNDDTFLVTPNWTTIFIEGLQKYNPPNIGIIGPKSDELHFLTYEFLHRTHIDIMGFYYPISFSTWWADFWISYVYKPAKYKKVQNVIVNHTSSLGRRYTPDRIGDSRTPEILSGKIRLQRYLTALKAESFKKNLYQPKRVISMSLTTMNVNNTYGAIRNAQLMPVHFPGWILYVYIPRTTSIDTKILRKLSDLGAVIKYVSDEVESKVPPPLWSYLVADEPDVDLFIIRSVLGRISDRDFGAVSKWIISGSHYHCIRDHPYHYITLLMSDLWGAKSELLRKAINTSMNDFLLRPRKHTKCKQPVVNEECETPINHELWVQMKNIVCHEMEICTRNYKIYRLQQLKKYQSYIGQRFDRYGEPIDRSNSKNISCTKIM